MLDTFLQVAYAHEARRSEEQAAHGLLKGLPEEDLRKIASGEVLASMDNFLERFRGTPLFEAALALEEEELQAEMADAERQRERRMESQVQDAVWAARDTLRIKKRLLELELAKQEAGMGSGVSAAPPANEAQGAPAPELAQGAGTLGPAPTEGAQGGAIGKTGGAVLAAGPLADALGRELARSDFKKAAVATAVVSAGESAGRILAKHASMGVRKEASALGAIGGALRGIGPAASGAFKALGPMAANFARDPRNLPTLVSAGTGAVGGLAHGLQRDEHGERHIARGLGQGLATGAVTGLLGHAGGHLGRSVAAGGGFGDALKSYGQGWANAAGRLAETARGAGTPIKQAGAGKVLLDELKWPLLVAGLSATMGAPVAVRSKAHQALEQRVDELGKKEDRDGIDTLELAEGKARLGYRKFREKFPVVEGIARGAMTGLLMRKAVREIMGIPSKHAGVKEVLRWPAISKPMGEVLDGKASKDVLNEKERAKVDALERARVRLGYTKPEPSGSG